MPTKKYNEAIELTTFKLDGVTFEQFIAANEDVDSFLRRQEGFRWRKMIQLENGTVADILGWDTVDAGTRAMHGLMSELSDSPVHATIKQSSVSWNIAPVLHSIG